MLGPLLESHAPVDVLAIMLGTNDLQMHFHKSSVEVALGVGTLVELAQRSGCGAGGGAPAILIIAPHRFGEMAPIERLYFTGKERDAADLAGALAIIADSHQSSFLDASDVVTAGTDGIHLDADGHRKLASAVSQRIEALLP
jgi:lysophospholipase L1-like esterase